VLVIVSTVLLNKKGLTLVEILIALVITLVLFLAMMQTSLLSIDMNTRNLIRDESVKIAEERINEARNDPFNTLVSDTGYISGDARCPADFPPSGIVFERNLRKIAGFDLCTNMTVNVLNPDSREVVVTVGWVWKGEEFTHTVSSIMRRTS
jgi:type IV pilus assembly protein PilV